MSSVPEQENESQDDFFPDCYFCPIRTLLARIACRAGIFRSNSGDARAVTLEWQYPVFQEQAGVL